MELRHQRLIENLDTLIAFSRSLDSRFDGKWPDNAAQRQAVPIFTKLVCHAITLKRLLPSPQEAVAELWDLGSACAVARSLIEAYDALAYYCVVDLSEAERDFRDALGRLHDAERRAKMLNLLGTLTTEAKSIRIELPKLRQRVIEHEVFTQLSDDIKRKVRARDAPQYCLSQKNRNLAVGLDHRHYQIATMHLSQAVHTTPMSINQWRNFRAGGAVEMRMMILPVQYALPYLAMGLSAMLHLFPEDVELPEDVAYALRLWRTIALQGAPDRGDQIPSG